MDFSFEWLGDDHKTWQVYPTTIQTELVTAALLGRQTSKITLPHNNSLAQVDFVGMTQTNCATKWQRKTRCCVKSDVDWVCWEWEDEYAFFNSYSTANCQILEKEYIKVEDNPQGTVIIDGYTVDFSDMTQKNNKTGTSRKVRRTETENIHSVLVDRKELEKRSVKKEIKEENADEDTENSAEGKKPSGKGKRKLETSTSSASKSSRSVGGSKSSGIKKLKFSEAVPVDEECLEKKDTAHVLVENKNIYDCMLNQTNVGNNNNKFYLIQLLKDNNSKVYYTWFRWGRVGYNGQNKLQSFGGDLDSAKHEFCKKFSDKTKNDWSERKDFEKYPGKYDLVAIDYGNSPSKMKEKVEPVDSDIEIPDSKLDAKVFEVLEMICSIKNMENTMKELEYDLSKAPLGKLTKPQIKAGYLALQDISKLLENKVKSGSKLGEACSLFYTRIPHVFGFKQPPMINTPEQIQSKVDLLDALSQIEIALTMIKQDSATDKHPIDQHYDSLDCSMIPMIKTDEMWAKINTYLQNTHAKTHNLYTMSLEEVFELKKPHESKQFNDLGNRHLLWHGSRLSNIVGILHHGLKIAPAEAPVTGYMFGKGVYFADMSSKSANYCFPSPSNTTGFLLLCDVALGKQNKLIDADYKANKLPAGCDSVFGIGREIPDPSCYETLSDGITLPFGKPKLSSADRTTLNYNEYVVYDTRQIQLKYLLKIKFDFDSSFI